MLKKVESSHLKMILKWRNSDEVRKASLDSSVILEADYYHWWSGYLKDPRKNAYIYSVDGVDLGIISWVVDQGAGCAVWSFYLSPEAPRGMGHGQNMLKEGLGVIFSDEKISEVVGIVLLSNEPSVQLHKKLGFQLISPKTGSEDRLQFRLER